MPTLARWTPGSRPSATRVSIESCSLCAISSDRSAFSECARYAAASPYCMRTWRWRSAKACRRSASARPIAASPPARAAEVLPNRSIGWDSTKSSSVPPTSTGSLLPTSRRVAGKAREARPWKRAPRTRCSAAAMLGRLPRASISAFWIESGSSDVAEATAVRDKNAKSTVFKGNSHRNRGQAPRAGRATSFGQSGGARGEPDPGGPVG